MIVKRIEDIYTENNKNLKWCDRFIKQVVFYKVLEKPNNHGKMTIKNKYGQIKTEYIQNGFY